MKAAPSTIKEKLEGFWERIRSARLYAGQPRNGQSVESVALAREALALAVNSGNEGLHREALRMLGYSLTANEDYGEAVDCYDSLIARYTDRGERLPARHTLGFIAALYHAGLYNRALETARESGRQFKEAGDDIGYARLCTNVANLYHRLDQHQRSIDYYMEAAETFRKAGDRQAEAQVYLNIGNTYSQTNRLEESDEMYRKSEEISSELALPELWAQAHYNRAYLQYLRGRYSDALHGFARMRQHFLGSGSERHHALCDLDEAEIYLQLNLSKDAATLATKAVEQFEKIGMSYERAKAQAFYGVALTQMRRFSEALEVYEKSQKAFEIEGNEYWTAVLDLHRADVHLSLERYWEATALASRARDKFDALGAPSRRVASRVLLGRLSFALGDLKAAENYIDEMFGIVKDANVPLLVFPCYVLSARIAEKRKDFKTAAEHYKLAAEDLEAHQSRLQHDELQVTFLSGRNQVYEALVRLSFDESADSMTRAYSWCERAKSRGLVELLSHHLPSIQSTADQTLLGRIRNLREELNLQYVRSKLERGPGFTREDSESIAIKEQELARSLRDVASSDPEFASLQQVSIVELHDVQGLIPDDTVIIEYFVTHDEVMAFLIEKGTAHAFRKLAPPSRVRLLQERLAFQLEKFLLGERFVKNHARQILEVTTHYLKTIYDLLVGPMISGITAKRLIIVPHGTLHFLPFHALFDGEQYLTDRFEITYAPSASVLKYCMEKPDIEDAQGVIVGVADENAPMVEDEVRRLREVFPGARYFEGAAATRDAFQSAAERAAFIHVATHVVFRHDNPMFSSFKLADGYVTAMDLFSLRCQTNLATLSGCSSGRGLVSGSDDLLGLMRAFLYAGARSLLVSLWNVSDESTAALMNHFYTARRDGASKGKALQCAMQQVREEFPDPFYWAPFALIGKT